MGGAIARLMASRRAVAGALAWASATLLQLLPVIAAWYGADAHTVDAVKQVAIGLGAAAVLLGHKAMDGITREDVALKTPIEPPPVPMPQRAGPDGVVLPTRHHGGD